MHVTFPDYLKCRWSTKVTRLETFPGPAHNQSLDVVFISIPYFEHHIKKMRRGTIIKKDSKFKVETGSAELEKSFIKDPDKSKYTWKRADCLLYCLFFSCWWILFSAHLNPLPNCCISKAMLSLISNSPCFRAVADLNFFCQWFHPIHMIGVS